MNYLAIDIGGTNTKSAIVNQNGKIIKKKSISTPKKYKLLLNYIKDLYCKENIDSGMIGLSCPGIYSPKKNIITGSSAVDYLINQDIVGDLENYIQDCKVIIENDGNSALLGEVWKGAAIGKNNVVILVIGSAVGGGALINDKILRGSHLNAGEFGYMMIDNNVVENNFHSLGGKCGLNGMINYVNRQGYNIKNGVELFQKIENDYNLNNLVKNQLKYLAISIINIQYILDPSLVIIGGAISKNKKYTEMLIASLNNIFDLRENYTTASTVLPAKNGNNANLLGIVYKCIQHKKNKIL